MSDAVDTGPELEEQKMPESQKKGGTPRLWVWIVAALCLMVLGAWSLSSRQAEPGTGSNSSGEGDVVPDTVAPQLLGIQDLTVAVGGSVSYRDGVSAVDDVDGPIPFQVDAEAVDLTTPGDYPVVYSAWDEAGNQTEMTATVTVIETLTVDQDIQDDDNDTPPASSTGNSGVPLEQITQADVDQLCDQILAQITHSGMSQREKAKAIFDYVNRHIKYVGTSDKSSWIVGAYVGFTRGRGDCYNYFACSKALLTRAGISNVDLHRVGGTSRHYWQLVNTGDGWYHFDTCPHPNGYPLYSFMITETQVRAYTEQARNSRKNYYVYDYDSCPVRPVGMPEESTVPPEKEPNPNNPDSSQLPGGDPISSQTPGTDTPDSSQTPGTGTPDSSQTPGTDTPDRSQTPGTDTPDSSQTPGTDTPDSSQTPGTDTPDSSQTPGTDTSDSSQLPGGDPSSSQAPGAGTSDGSQTPEGGTGEVVPNPQREQSGEGEKTLAA